MDLLTVRNRTITCHVTVFFFLPPSVKFATIQPSWFLLIQVQTTLSTRLPTASTLMIFEFILPVSSGVLVHCPLGQDQHRCFAPSHGLCPQTVHETTDEVSVYQTRPKHPNRHLYRTSLWAFIIVCSALVHPVILFFVGLHAFNTALHGYLPLIPDFFSYNNPGLSSLFARLLPVL